MAVLDHYLQKRDALYDPKATPAKLSALGKIFFEAKAYSDALDFYERAKDEDGIALIKKMALDEGDTFILAHMERLDTKSVDLEEWEHTGEIARQKGRESMALFAEERIAERNGEGQADPGEEPIEE